MENPQPKNFEQLADAVKYYRWFADTVSPWIGKRMIDIGCGYGNVLANFLERESVLGIDIEPAYLEHIRRRFHDHPNFRAERMDITHPETVDALRSFAPDTILAFNVLEHLADDKGVAKNLFKILQPQGHAVILVPAFNMLMSPYDRSVGHYRRYTKDGLAKLMQEAGFTVVHARYFNALGALAWLWTYTLRKQDNPGMRSVRLLEFLVPFLKTMENVLPMPFGVSTIVIGKKETTS